MGRGGKSEGLSFCSENISLAQSNKMTEQEGKKEGKAGRKTGGGTEEEEGRFLLGRPTFTAMENGRFRCVETGHEVLTKDMESYCNSKRCRLGLIDAALLHKKPPLNMFKQHPDFKSKIICKLTKDVINKSEEHIWKHITGRRFQNQLEKKEAEKGLSEGRSEQVDKLSCKPSRSGTRDIRKIKIKTVGKDDFNASEVMDDNADTEEPDFWMPPVGSCGDFNDSKDHRESCTKLVHESEEDTKLVEADEDGCKTMESESLSVRTKRLAIEVGPSSFAPRKKKNKKTRQEQ